MIKIDLALAVSLYLTTLVSAIIGPWAILRKYKDKDLSLDPRFTWHCSVCTYTYINTRDEGFSKCPRCGSMNKRED